MAKNDIKTEYMQFADRLRTEIKKKGLTQAKVGEAIGAKGVTVGSWCSGRSAPDDDTVRALEDVLGLKGETLVSLLPEGRRKRGRTRTAVPHTPPHPSPTQNKTTAKPSEVLQSIERTAQPAATKGPLETQKAPEKERVAPELRNMPWCMPAQVRHMRKVLDQYEGAAYDYYFETCKQESGAVQAAKKDFLNYARADFKAVRVALADLEHQLRCLLGIPE